MIEMVVYVIFLALICFNWDTVTDACRIIVCLCIYIYMGLL